MTHTLTSVAVSLVCSILLFAVKDKSRKGTLYSLGRVVVVFWGISLLLLGRYFHQTALPLSSFFSALFLVLGVQVTLWAIGISLQILGNVPNAPETLPESSLRHRPSDSGGSAMKVKASIESKESVLEDEKEMVKSPGHPGRFRLRAIERKVSILASLAIVAGVFFAISQIRLSSAIEKRRVAVEAVRQIRSAEFIKAFRRLKTVYQTRQVDEKDKDSVIDSLNHVMNVYDDIAVVYINDIADKCIIKDGVYLSAMEMSDISAALSASPPENRNPPENRKHFDLLLKLMGEESCEGRHLSPTN
jgi:hypothetical protein